MKKAISRIALLSVLAGGVGQVTWGSDLETIHQYIRKAPRLADLEVRTEDFGQERRLLQAWGIRSDGDGSLLVQHPFAEPLSSLSLIVPAAWLKREPGYDPHNGVDPKLMAKDVEYLRLVMQYRYGGWQRAVDRGWNWDRFFADWHGRLSSSTASRISFEDATAFFQRYKDFQVDNHTLFEMKLDGGALDLDALTARYYQASQTYLLDEVPQGWCSSVEDILGKKWPLAPKDAGARPREVSVYRGGPLSREFLIAAPASRRLAFVTCAGRRIRVSSVYTPRYADRLLEIGRLAGADPSLPTVKSDGKIAYVRLSTFGGKACQAMQSYPIPPAFGQERLLVLDLRANGGGDFVGCAAHLLSPWMQLTEQQTKAFITKRTRRSCLDPAVAGLENGRQPGWIPLAESAVNGGSLEILRPLLQRDYEIIRSDSMAGECQRPDEVLVAPRNMADRSWTDFFTAARDTLRLVLLTDNYCGSDCELAVNYLALAYPSLIVGTNTMGLSQFTVPVETTLPFTGVKIELAQGLSNHYGDDRSFDGFGFTADIVLPRDIDQSAASVAGLIQKLAVFRRE